MSAKLGKLLEPLQVRQITLRNRIVKPAQVLGFAAEDGNASPMLIDFYEAVAKGGAGLIIVESSCIDYPIGGKGQNRLRIDDDSFIPSFSRLAESIHRYGCPTLLQLSHRDHRPAPWAEPQARQGIGGRGSRGVSHWRLRRRVALDLAGDSRRLARWAQHLARQRHARMPA